MNTSNPNSSTSAEAAQSTTSEVTSGVIQPPVEGDPHGDWYKYNGKEYDTHAEAWSDYLDDQNAALVAMLRKLGWCGTSVISEHEYRSWDVCPVCDNECHSNGHQPDCELAALLAGSLVNQRTDQQLDAALARTAEATGVLREIEWRGGLVGLTIHTPLCPLCLCKVTHKPNCKLAALLNSSADEAPEGKP